MIFCGDFVYPFEEKINFFVSDKDFLKKPKVLNLESLIINPNKNKKLTSGIALHSSENTYAILKNLNVQAVGLANNHTTDYTVDISAFKTELCKHAIVPFGIGENLKDAINPILLEDEIQQYVLLAFGWNVIGCHYATNKSAGIAPLYENIIIESIKTAKKLYPDKKVILFLHWNYEFEFYPQPADRKLAFSAIEAGADAIIGHHSHIVGPYEIYLEKPIFYSLGNFYIPEYNYNGFHLQYKSQAAKVGLCIEYFNNPEEINLYWIENINNQVRIIDKEILSNSNRIENISNIFQTDLNQYTKWFKIHRIKKKLLPVYKEHTKNISSFILLKILTFRNTLVYLFTSLGLRKRNS